MDGNQFCCKFFAVEEAYCTLVTYDLENAASILLDVSFFFFSFFIQGDDEPDSSEGGAHDIIGPSQSSLLHDQINSTNKRLVKESCFFT